MASSIEPIVNPRELITVIQLAIKHHWSVLIIGSPGQGKTQIAQQAAESVKADFIATHPPVHDPTTYQGMPAIIDEYRESILDKDTKRWIEQEPEKKAVFLPFGDLDRLINAKKETVFFMDDMGPATNLVQGACMQLVCEREVNSHRIADCVTIIAATNKRSDKAGVRNMIEPLKNKFTFIIELVNTIDDMTMHSIKQNWPHEIRAFMRTFPEVLNAFKPSPDLSNTPTCRGIEHAVEIFQSGINGSLRPRLFAGAIGTEFAVRLEGFLKFYKEIPDPDMVIKFPEKADIPGVRSNGEIENPGPLHALCGALSSRASEATIENIMIYAERLPEEFNIALTLDSIRKDPNALAKGKYWIDWNAKHQDILI